MFARYAQEYGGQKLHIVPITSFQNQGVALRAICGRHCNKRGNWRYTINITLGELCGNCRRFARNAEIVEF